MKVFRVVTERDERTIKEPGVTETIIRREEYRYAAEKIQQVWEAIQPMLSDEECLVIAVIEEHPAITLLAATGEEGK